MLGRNKGPSFEDGAAAGHRLMELKVGYLSIRPRLEHLARLPPEDQRRGVFELGNELEANRTDYQSIEARYPHSLTVQRYVAELRGIYEQISADFLAHPVVYPLITEPRERAEAKFQLERLLQPNL